MIEPIKKPSTTPKETSYDADVLAHLKTRKWWFKGTLAEDMMCSTSSVRKALLSLEHRGHAKRERVPWPGNPGYADKWSAVI